MVTPHKHGTENEHKHDTINSRILYLLIPSLPQLSKSTIEESLVDNTTGEIKIKSVLPRNQGL